MAGDSTNKVQIQIYNNITKEDFLNNVYPLRVPVVLRGLDIGTCTNTWTVDYLCQHAGKKEVKIHVCQSAQMDFLSKNFIYKTLPFDEFVRRAAQTTQSQYFICPEEKYYLRSLGDDPRKDVADIKKQYPSLCNDIILPDLFPQDHFTSSVFRIASKGTQLWTHYDIMDNFLIQISGLKRAVLFSPRNATDMYLAGDKSEIIDIDNPDIAKYPNFINVPRYECQLQPGDILFIPALWFHNMTSLDFGIAVNVFWRHLNDSFYDKKDVYSNKDPVIATRASQILDRALKTLDELPEEYRDFYARKMVTKIQTKCYSKHLV